MRLDVVPGPWLLSSPDPGLGTHRARFGAVPRLSTDQLVAVAHRYGVVGRGGAGFPFAVKLRTAAATRGLRRHVVVNLSEGEPASAKDAALVTTSPHLVLDGAELTAAALGVRTVELVVPRADALLEQAVVRAVRERQQEAGSKRLRWRIHRAEDRFVSGEASAVTELIDGRPNLPVTSWVPTAVKGVNGRPTVLSNAETYAQVAGLALAGDRVPGPSQEPGTRLLSVVRGPRTQVCEVVHGTPWSAVLSPQEIAGPVLIGGYHGQWAAAAALRTATVSAGSLSALGLGLGAGVVIPLQAGECPLALTATLVRYLAGQSAGRCGPCVNGLPALATEFSDMVAGRGGAEVGLIADLVRGRGACAHPDGTARLVASACAAFAGDVRAHQDGRCVHAVTVPARSA